MPNETGEEDIIQIGQKTYTVGSISKAAQDQVANIRFCDTQIRQLQNELAVADTARLAYKAALTRESQTNKADT